jgi:hypothetical protein
VNWYSNIRDSSDKNQNPRIEWRRKAPSLDSWFDVLSKTYIDITYSSALGTSQESEKAVLSHFLGFLI